MVAYPESGLLHFETNPTFNMFESSRAGDLDLLLRTARMQWPKAFRGRGRFSGGGGGKWPDAANL